MLFDTSFELQILSTVVWGYFKTKNVIFVVFLRYLRLYGSTNNKVAIYLSSSLSIFLAREYKPVLSRTSCYKFLRLTRNNTTSIVWGKSERLDGNVKKVIVPPMIKSSKEKGGGEGAEIGGKC